MDFFARHIHPNVGVVYDLTLNSLLVKCSLGVDVVQTIQLINSGTIDSCQSNSNTAMSDETDDSIEETTSELTAPAQPSQTVERLEAATALAKVLPGLVPNSLKKADAGLSTGIEGLLNVMNFHGLHLWNKRRRLIAERNMRALINEFGNMDENDLAAAPMEVEQPILERLSATSDEKLSSILIKLLLAAASKSRANLAHPSMVTVAENLSPDEALILSSFTSVQQRIAMIGVSFVDNRPERKFATLDQAKYFSELKNLNLTHPQNIDFYIGNLISLGLFSTDRGFVPVKVNDGSYEPHPIYEQLVEEAKQKFKTPNTAGEWTFTSTKYIFKATEKGQMLISILNSIDVKIS